MAKSSSSFIAYLYLIGMALVVIGCFLPLATHLGGRVNGSTAFSVITGKGSSILKIGSVLTLLGAAAGIVLTFVTVPIDGRLLKLLALIVSLAGGLYVFFNINGDAVKLFAKATKSTFGVGFYVIIIGWMLATAGAILEKK